MATLKEIDIISLAKILAAIYFILGILIAVVLFALAGAFHSAVGSGFSRAFGAGAAVLFTLPVLLLLFGFTIGAIEAWLYNVIAARIGGIKLVLKKGELLSVDPLSAGKVLAVAGIIFGFVFGIIFAIFAAVSGSTALAVIGIGFIILFMIIFPIIFFVAVALECIVYNFLASKIGAVTLYFKGSELKRVGALRYAKIAAVFGAIVGLIEGIEFVFVVPSYNGIAMFAHSLGLLSIIVFPILYFVIAFVFAGFEVLLYNFLVKSIGGVKLTIS